MISRIKIKISGKNPSYFLKELILMKIKLYKIDSNKDLIVIVDYEDYLKIKDIKTTYKIKVLRRYGICKYKYLLKKYFSFIITILLGLLFIIILSNIIFKVEVITPNKELLKTIKKDLENEGIKKFKLKKSYNTIQKIKEKILEQEKDKLEWLEIEEHGVKYKVVLEERKKNIEKKECLPRHIISTKTAIIHSISASTGEITVKKNDFVNKGDILISGFIHNKEEIMSKVCARGKVYGETWYKVKVLHPKTTTIKTTTKNKRLGFSLHIFNYNIELFNKYKQYKNKKISLVKSNLLPINISITLYQKLKISQKENTKKTIISNSLKKAELEIKKKLQPDESIISKKVLKILKKNSKIEVEVFFKIKENITTYFDISNIDIESLNKKEEE